MKYELRRGESIHIDLATDGDGEPNIDWDPVLTLSSRRGQYHEMPSVKVDKEYTGFEAQIQSITLTSTDEDAEGSTLDSYEIAISWAGGADSSGADIAVTYPDTGEIAKASIWLVIV
jgi:hypothetical protein